MLNLELAEEQVELAARLQLTLEFRSDGSILAKRRDGQTVGLWNSDREATIVLRRMSRES